ncbi:MAG: hypothetical protein HZC11_09140 [Nitrospirae bacterium]|nr:hypothetical protein [Nitrospirota bacterium]
MYYKSAVFFITGAILLLALPYQADAYIDPNTGGFFFTSVLPFVYGILAAVVVFWKRIALTVKNIFSRKK